MAELRAALEAEVTGLSRAHRALLRGKLGKGQVVGRTRPGPSDASARDGPRQQHLSHLTAPPHNEEQFGVHAKENSNALTNTSSNSNSNSDKSSAAVTNGKEDPSQPRRASLSNRARLAAPPGVCASSGPDLKEAYQNEVVHLVNAHRYVKEKLRSNRLLGEISRGPERTGEEASPLQPLRKFQSIQTPQSESVDFATHLSATERLGPRAPPLEAPPSDDPTGTHDDSDRKRQGTLLRGTSFVGEPKEDVEDQVSVLRARLAIAESLLARAASVSASAASKVLAAQQRRSEELEEKLSASESLVESLRAQFQQSQDELLAERQAKEGLESALAAQETSDQRTAQSARFRMRRRTPSECVETFEDAMDDGRLLLTSGSKQQGLESKRRPPRSPAAEVIYWRNEASRMELELEAQARQLAEAQQKLQEAQTSSASSAAAAPPTPPVVSSDEGAKAKAKAGAEALRERAMRSRRRAEEDAESDRLWLLSGRSTAATSGAGTPSSPTSGCPVWQGGILQKLCAKNGRWQDRFITLAEVQGKPRGRGKGPPQTGVNEGRRHWELRWSKVAKGPALASKFTALPLGDVVHVDFGPHLLPEALKPLSSSSSSSSSSSLSSAPTLLALYTSQRAFHFAVADAGLLEALVVACSALSPNLAPIPRRALRLFRARCKLGQDRPARVKAMVAAIRLTPNAPDPKQVGSDLDGSAAPAGEERGLLPSVQSQSQSQPQPVGGAGASGLTSGAEVKQQLQQHREQRPRASRPEAVDEVGPAIEEDESARDDDDGDEDDDEGEESEEEEDEESEEAEQDVAASEDDGPSPRRSPASPTIQDADELERAS